MVELGPAARELVVRYYEPIGRDGAAMLDRYGEAELAAIRRFAADALALQERYLAELERKREE
jgi:hypothetical protein